MEVVRSRKGAFFRLAMHANGAECVFASEWDKFARQTYEVNFYSLASDIFDNGLFAGGILLPNVDEKYTISERLYAGHLRRKRDNKKKGNRF